MNRIAYATRRVYRSSRASYLRGNRRFDNSPRYVLNSSVLFFTTDTVRRLCDENLRRFPPHPNSPASVTLKLRSLVRPTLARRPRISGNNKNVRLIEQFSFFSARRFGVLNSTRLRKVHFRSKRVRITFDSPRYSVTKTPTYQFVNSPTAVVHGNVIVSTIRRRSRRRRRTRLDQTLFRRRSERN